MLDIFSASGLRVQTPCGPRKSGMPESVEMPAPLSTTIFEADPTQPRTVPVVVMAGLRLRNLDLAAGAADARHRALRHDDRGGGLAAQLLQLLHGALDRFLGERAEFLRRVLERAGADLERDRQRARGREHLRLADVEHGARTIALA